MKRGLSSVLGVLLLAAASFPARAGSGDLGTVSGEFLKQPIGARAVAMGEAAVALTDDASSVFWNPAALTRVRRRSLFFMSSFLLDSVNLEALSYAQSLGRGGAWGVGFQYLAAGAIQQTDASGFNLGSTLNPHDFAASLSYALGFKGHSLGLSGKFVNSKLVDAASTLTGDLGYLSPSFWGDRIRLAAAAQNLGGTLTYDQVGEKLPRSYRLGGSFSPRRGLNLGLDIVFPNDNKMLVAVGGEKTLRWRDFDLAGRLGYNTRSTGGDLGGATGLSAGLGLGRKNTSLDYALVLFGDLGMTHRVSLSSRF